MAVRELEFEATSRSGSVSALLLEPPGAEILYVLAHGAGAGMRHAFMEAVAMALGDRRVATFRYQFPYVEQGRRRPDPPAVLEATVRAAIAAGRRACPDLPVIAGGKSMGGRMTTQAAAAGGLDGVRGIALLGFPLHPARRPATSRGSHLADVELPMLFVQGSRDALAELALLAPLCTGLGDHVTLHVIDQADHSFAVPKKAGRSATSVMAELAETVADWARGNLL